MPRVDGPSIGVDRVVVAAMLDSLLPAFVAARAQRLQLAVPELNRIAAVRLDVISDADVDHSAFCQAHRAERLALKLTTRSAMPQCFIMQSATHWVSP